MEGVFQFVLFELSCVAVLLVEKSYLILDIESNLKLLSRKFYLVLTIQFSIQLLVFIYKHPYSSLLFFRSRSGVQLVCRLPKWRFDSSCQGPIGLSFAEVVVWLLKKKKKKRGSSNLRKVYSQHNVFWVFGLFYNVCCGIKSSRVLIFYFVSYF